MPANVQRIMQTAAERYVDALAEANGNPDAVRLGNCERCGAPYKAAANGRVAAHVCYDRDVPDIDPDVILRQPARAGAGADDELDDY